MVAATCIVISHGRKGEESSGLGVRASRMRKKDRQRLRTERQRRRSRGESHERACRYLGNLAVSMLSFVARSIFNARGKREFPPRVRDVYRGVWRARVTRLSIPPSICVEEFSRSTRRCSVRHDDESLLFTLWGNRSLRGSNEFINIGFVNFYANFSHSSTARCSRLIKVINNSVKLSLGSIHFDYTHFYLHVYFKLGFRE